MNLEGAVDEMFWYIREDNEDIPIIITSADAESLYLMNAILLQVKDYMLKPVDLTMLLTKIEQILKKKENK